MAAVVAASSVVVVITVVVIMADWTIDSSGKGGRALTGAFGYFSSLSSVRYRTDGKLPCAV